MRISSIDLAVIGCSHGELPLILADHPVRILRGCSSFNFLLGVLMHGFDHNIIPISDSILEILCISTLTSVPTLPAKILTALPQ